MRVTSVYNMYIIEVTEEEIKEQKKTEKKRNFPRFMNL